MKKILFALSAVALLFATSCKKDQNAPENITAGEGEFLATIDNGANPQNAPVVKDGMTTKTTIDGSNYVIWENGDEISINGSTYTTTSTPGNTVVFSGGNATGTTFHAFYPASIAGTGAAGSLPATQTIELDGNNNITVRNLPMYATSNNNQLTFHNICAALKITIPSFVNGATSIVVSSSDKAMNGAFTVTNNTAVMTATTLTDADKQVTISKSTGTFATGEVVYIAVPANTYGNFKVEFFNNTTSMWNKTLTTCTLNVNNVYNINMTEMSDPNLLPGLFTISPTKQVKFTKGNLTGTAPNYSFASSQFEIGGTYKWTTAWQSTVNVLGEDYRVLTYSEWNYLLERTMTGTVPSYKIVTINGNYAAVLYPDNYTGTVADSYNTTEWQTAEQNGAVAFYRTNQDDPSSSYYGSYWTATLDEGNNDFAATFIFYKYGSISEVTMGSNIKGVECCIRLVKDNQ